MDNYNSGIEFEYLCQSLVEKMGFTTQTTKTTGDGGIDIIAYNHQPLFSGKYIIQCKRYRGSVGEPIIRDLYGVVTSERANKGILMTTGCFTKSAIDFANGKPIELIDGEKMEWLLSQYGLLASDNENKMSLEEVFDYYYMESEYRDYREKAELLKRYHNEQKHAELITQLIQWAMDEFPDISEPEHRNIVYDEIQRQIVAYISSPRSEKSKSLAYIYHMIYVQLSILKGEFREAIKMFSQLINHKEFQLTIEETENPKRTKVIWDEHQSLFWCMYFTLYNMMQLTVLLDDFDLQTELLFDEKYYGYQPTALNITNKTIAYYVKNQIKNVAYWQGELDAINNIKKLNSVYLFNWYEAKMYYEYTYCNKNLSKFRLNRYDVHVDDDRLVIDSWGEVENIQQRIDNYKL